MAKLADLLARVPGDGAGGAKSARYEIYKAEKGEICDCEYLAPLNLSPYDILDMPLDR